MATFGIDLKENYDFDLSSFQNFKDYINRLPPAASQGYTPTRKAITFLQKYLSERKSLNGKNVSVARKEFFSSKQFIDTFTNELELLQVLQAPETYQILKQQQTKESKSGITLFLNAILKKSGKGSWRDNYIKKNLVGDGTLCKYVQPIVSAGINIDPDYTIPANVQAHFQNYSTYVNGLEQSMGPGARQDNSPSQLFNYDFASGFTKSGTCYLCDSPIGRRTRGGFQIANCEHIMPLLSALQSFNWFISKDEDTPTLGTIKRYINDAIQTQKPGPLNSLTVQDLAYINKLLKISPEFAWSHLCCNMVKSDVDFLYLDTNNGQYQPNFVNIGIYLNWLFDPSNAVSYDCGYIQQMAETHHGSLAAARANAEVSIMDRVNPLCQRLNAKNGQLNTNEIELLKVYGIFLLLQHLKVSTIDDIVVRVGFGGGGSVSKKKSIKNRILSGGIELVSEDVNYKFLRTKSGNLIKYNKETGQTQTQIAEGVDNQILSEYEAVSQAKVEFYSKVERWPKDEKETIRTYCQTTADGFNIEDHEAYDDYRDSLDRSFEHIAKRITNLYSPTLKITEFEKPWAESMFYDYIKLQYTRRKLTEYQSKLPSILGSLSAITVASSLKITYQQYNAIQHYAAAAALGITPPIDYSQIVNITFQQYCDITVLSITPQQYSAIYDAYSKGITTDMFDSIYQAFATAKLDKIDDLLKHFVDIRFITPDQSSNFQPIVQLGITPQQYKGVSKFPILPIQYYTIVMAAAGANTAANTFCLFWNDIPDNYISDLLQYLLYSVKSLSLLSKVCYDIILTTLILCYDYNIDICLYLSGLTTINEVVINTFHTIFSNEQGIPYIWSVIPPFLQRKIFHLYTLTLNESNSDKFPIDILAIVNREIASSCDEIESLTSDFTMLQQKIVTEVNSFRTAEDHVNSLTESLSYEIFQNSLLPQVVAGAAYQQQQQQALYPQQALYREQPGIVTFFGHGGKRFHKRKTTRRNVVVIKRKKHNKSRRHNTRKHKTRKHKTHRHKMRRHKRSS
jgi:hypothetical protein